MAYLRAPPTPASGEPRLTFGLLAGIHEHRPNHLYRQLILQRLIPEARSYPFPPRVGPEAPPSTADQALAAAVTSVRPIVTRDADSRHPTVLFPPVHDPSRFIRIVAVSDTHKLHRRLQQMPGEWLPPADIFVHAGDFSEVGLPDDINDFADWLHRGLPQYRHKVVIAGNHDLSLEKHTYVATNWRRFSHPRAFDSDALIQTLRGSCTFLQHEAKVIEGYRFFGTPYQPEFCDWAFNLNRQEECHNMWATMPTDTDILVSHGPPLGHGDMCSGGALAGCADLLDWIMAVRKGLTCDGAARAGSSAHAGPDDWLIRPGPTPGPGVRLHLFGHIHEGYGVTTDGAAVFGNASTLDGRYDPDNMNPPLVFDLPRRAVASVAQPSSS